MSLKCVREHTELRGSIIVEINLHWSRDPKARFRRLTFHVPNRMQMNLNNNFRSLTLGSAYEKFDV